MEEDDFEILGQQEFEDMDLPSVLYKYRNWSDPFHKTILTDNQLYLSSPADFLDKDDCHIPIRYDLLTDDEIYQKYLTMSKRENDGFSRQQHRKLARDWAAKGIMRDKVHLKEHDEQYFKDFHEIYGVLSMTAIPHGTRLWDDYANNHSGFCVGFHCPALLQQYESFGGGGEVIYFDELPIILDTFSFAKKSHLQVYSKLRKYEYEQEYRLSKFGVGERRAIIPVEIYAEIILGARISDRDKEEILNIVSTDFENVKILQSKLENNEVTFEDI